MGVWEYKEEGIVTGEKKWRRVAGVLRIKKMKPQTKPCIVCLWLLETSWPILLTVTATWLGWESGSGRRELSREILDVKNRTS